MMTAFLQEYPAISNTPRIHLVRWLAALALASAAAVTPAQPREDLDRRVEQTLVRFRAESPAGAEMMKSAAGVLVFPEVVKVGFGIGGEYGEGALLVDGLSAGYYATSTSSFGLQLGAEARSQVILFMTERALLRFRRSREWEIGVDGDITMLREDSGNTVDDVAASAPIVGFAFSGRGVMYNLSLEGNSIKPLDQ